MHTVSSLKTHLPAQLFCNTSGFSVMPAKIMMFNVCFKRPMYNWALTSGGADQKFPLFNKIAPDLIHAVSCTFEPKTGQLKSRLKNGFHSYPELH